MGLAPYHWVKIMSLLSGVADAIRNLFSSEDSELVKTYQITFTVDGTGDWDGLHTLNIPVKGKYSGKKAILAIRRANGVEGSAKVVINEVKKL